MPIAIVIALVVFLIAFLGALGLFVIPIHFILGLIAALALAILIGGIMSSGWWHWPTAKG